MIRATIVIALAVSVFCLRPALAAEADVYCQTGTSSTGAPIFLPASSTNPCPVTTTPAAVLPVTASSSLESNHVLKGAAGTFLGAQVNTTSVSVWVMAFNATSLPANGAVTPVAVWQVPSNTTLSISEAPGVTFGTGITLGCSTTGPFTLTASATCAFMLGIVQ